EWFIALRACGPAPEDGSSRTFRLQELTRMLGELLSPVSRGLCAIAAGRHVAPAAPSILRAVVEHARAAWICAAPDSRELAEHERIRGGFHERYHEARECISHRNEAAHEGAIAA